MTATQIPANLISSQRFLREDIVAHKLATQNFTVVVHEVEVDDEIYQVVVDGHHGLHAALRAGAELTFVRARDTGDYDFHGKGTGETLLQNLRNDSDWYYVATGQNAFGN